MVATQHVCPQGKTLCTYDPDLSYESSMLTYADTHLNEGEFRHSRISGLLPVSANGALSPLTLSSGMWNLKLEPRPTLAVARLSFSIDWALALSRGTEINQNSDMTSSPSPTRQPLPPSKAVMRGIIT